MKVISYLLTVPTRVLATVVIFVISPIIIFITVLNMENGFKFLQETFETIWGGLDD